MNFENYNKIYQEILNDENNELTANFILNKYEISHEEELINILNQIKKNEYISSDDKTINRLLNELDDNEELLNIYEIINVKDKVIDSKTVETYINENEKKISIEPKAENIIKDEEKVASVSQSKNKELKFSKKYFYIITLIIILFVILITISGEKNSIIHEKKENNVEKEIITENKELKNIDIIQEKTKKEENNSESKLLKIETQLPKEEIVLGIKNTVIEESKSKVEEIQIENRAEEEQIKNSDDKLDLIQLVETEVKSSTNEKSSLRNIPTLYSLDEIDKYEKELKYDDGKLLFRGQKYAENDMLFGFSIFKLTPIYVKFQDEKKQIRKRFMLKK